MLQDIIETSNQSILRIHQLFSQIFRKFHDSEAREIGIFQIKALFQRFKHFTDGFKWLSFQEMLQIEIIRRQIKRTGQMINTTQLQILY